MWEVYFEQNILTIVCLSRIFRRVWRYQRGNQNQSQSKDRQHEDQKKKDKQQSTKYYS